MWNEEEEEDILRSQSEEREGRRDEGTEGKRERERERERDKATQFNATKRASLPRRRIISYKFVPPHLKTRGWVHSISDVIVRAIARSFRARAHAVTLYFE